ncbi:Surface polysaccharide O-acyltransferase, integral membrane enzyme [Lachnospiraceae bacterium]|nr:Surface polysaccharide O-acyltransferase, integral membrane enzyme [Lachnospiraceae bacterium]
MNRNAYYDRLRVLAMFLVIGVHSVGSIAQFAEGTFQETVVTVLGRINSLGVPTFFALSGMFILAREYDDLKGFYKKRLVRIGIPYLIYAVVYVCYFTGIEKNDKFGVPLAYVRDVITGNVHPTHWFVYTILGFYFAAPFLSKMMHALNDTELKVLVCGCFIVIAAGWILSYFGMGFGVSSVVFNSDNLWMFIGGYAINRIIVSDRRFEWIRQYHLISALTFLVLFVVTNELFFGHIAVFLALIDGGKEVGTSKSLFDKVIGDFAGHSYSVYLIHAAVISLILRVYKNWESFFILKCILIYPVVFIVSYLITRVVDFVLTDRLISIALIGAGKSK